MSESIAVLIIDDSEDDRFLYRRALQSSAAVSYRILEKDCGEDGLECLEYEKPDCILLDYSLPGRNGIEVLKRIKAKHPFVPVVMLTGQGNEMVAVSAMREGAQHYVVKSSITPDELQRSIRVAIDHCGMQKHIEEQRISLELFTRAMAHDLREPVRTIRSFLELMTRPDLPPEKAQKYFTYIHQAAERMGGLIDAVYAFMRLDGSAQHIARELCDVSQVLIEAQQNLAALIGERKATIKTTDMPIVLVNKMQLIQVFQNLLSNAIYHSGGNASVNISMCSAQDRWVFRVADNGPGVAQEYISKIFEPFKRLTQSHAAGLGLGLSICKKIVESHGGRIWYEPGVPHGACFCFTLPVVQGMSDAKSGGAEQGDDAGAAEQASNRLANLLLVEDNEADVELARFLLLEEQRLKCNLYVSRNCEEAKEMIRQKGAGYGAIDLVLLDINMPGADGFELLSFIRKQKMYSDIPVVMCSTSSYDKDMARAKLFGANGYMVKPVHLDKLRPLLKSMPHLHFSEEEAGLVLQRAPQPMDAVQVCSG